MVKIRHFGEGESMEEGWLMADGFLGSHVAAADQSTRDAVLCGHGDNAASVCGPLGSDLAGGKVVSQLHLQDGQWWWKRGQRGPLSPCLPVCRCYINSDEFLLSESGIEIETGQGVSGPNTYL